ncbi:MAG: hypothetical protein D6725_00480, partial [Planctomycetota bacterium]
TPAISSAGSTASGAAVVSPAYAGVPAMPTTPVVPAPVGLGVSGGYALVPVVVVPVVAPAAATVVTDPYVVHFGQPADAFFNGPGHLRFPYYSYRRPWFFPGPPRFNRTIVW